MPHAGLMDESGLGPVEGPLLRAKLHYRGGRRRIAEGKVPAGIVTLYDALEGALQWYVALPARKRGLDLSPGEPLHDERSIYRVLVRSGVLDGTFDFDAFDRLTDSALADDLTSCDPPAVLAGIESVFTQLGILPFDEAALPPEDPATF